MNDTFTPFSESELRNVIEISGMNNPLCTAATPLSHSELHALKTLATRQNRPFTLRHLYGDHWYTIRGVRKFGRRVRASMAAGYLPDLREVGKKSKSFQYEWGRGARDELTTNARSGATAANLCQLAEIGSDIG